MAGLFGSNILEIALGLIFVYFILSLICSHINEILAGLLKLRARDLEKGIQNLLCDPDLARSVLKHPLIKAMGNTRAEVITVRMMAGEEEEESNIAPVLRALSTPARLVIDAIRSLFRFVAEQFRRPIVPLYPAPSEPEKKKDFAGKPSYIDARTFSQALLDQFAPASEGPVTVDRVHDRAQEMLVQGMKEIQRQVMGLMHISAVADQISLKKIRAAIEALPQSGECDNVLSYIKNTPDLTVDQLRQFAGTLGRNPQIDEILGVVNTSAKIASIEEMRAAIDELPQSAAQDRVLAFIKDKKNSPTVDELEQFVREKILRPSTGVLEAAMQQSFDKMLSAVQGLPETLARTAMLQMIEDNSKITIARSMLSMVSNSQGAQQLFASIEELLKNHPDPAKLQQLLKDLRAAATLGQMRALLVGLPPDIPGRQAALDLLDRGQAEVDALRANIETWYDNAMDRVSGIYKRRVQTWLLGIALGLVLFLGADTFKIVRTLATNTDLRTALAARASATAANGASDLPGASAVLSSTTVTTTTAATNNITTTKTTITTAISNTNALLAQLDQFNQLFGYSDVLNQLPDKNKQSCRQIADWWQSGACWVALGWENGISWLLWKIVGLVITAFAVSLGAPFWFDLLQKIVNIRSSGQRPEKSETKAKKQQSSA